MDQAMDLAVMFSESNECTRENPVKVVVGEDLHGTKTDIHSSKLHGILAYVHGKVNIQLPSQHNTSHMTTLEGIEFKTVAVSSPTSTPTVYIHTHVTHG